MARYPSTGPAWAPAVVGTRAWWNCASWSSTATVVSRRLGSRITARTTPGGGKRRRVADLHRGDGQPALIEAAAEAGADALLVHHGYFWRGEPAPLTA